MSETRRLIAATRHLRVATDFLNDVRGQRTGFRSLELRPELRFEHSLNVDEYDDPSGIPGGGKQSQLILAADAIPHV